MAYSKHDFQDGQVLTGAAMDDIDSAVETLDAGMTAAQEDIAELQEGIATKAEINGYYETLTAGNAEQLLATTGAEDRAPYLQRQTGGGVNVGDRAVEKIVGGTIAWNQLNNNGGVGGDQGGVSVTNIGDGTWTLSGGPCTGGGRKSIATGLGSVFQIGHVYYVTHGSTVDGSDNTWRLVVTSSGSIKHSITAKDGKLIKPTANVNTLDVQISTGADFTEGSVTLVPQLFDLTQMFGSTVADAVYAMEQATTGAGVAWFRAMFPESYYPYNAGELMSVQTSGKTATSADGTVVKTYPLDSSLILRGIPKWDSVKGTMYYDGDEYTSDGRVTWRYGIVDLGTLNWQAHTDSGSTDTFRAALSGAKRAGNLFCPAYKNGSGEDDTIFIHSLAARLYLRDADFDGMTGAEVTTALSGVYLVYELATPTTESATPYTGTQWVEASGTEAFIDAGTETGRVAVPVGHDTFYPTDLRGGLETLLSPEVTVTGTTATITAERDRRYLCGTMAELSFTPCASGLCEVRFTSGTTAALLTVPNTVKWPSWFDPAHLEASTTYEISIADGVYGAVMTWAT